MQSWEGQSLVKASAAETAPLITQSVERPLVCFDKRSSRIAVFFFNLISIFLILHLLYGYALFRKVK